MSFWGWDENDNPRVVFDTLRMPLFSRRRYRQVGGLKKREDEQIDRNNDNETYEYYLSIIVVPWTQFGTDFDAAVAQSFRSSKCSCTTLVLL